VDLSDEVCVFPQEHKGALLHWSRVSELSLGKPANVPELQPLEIVGAYFDVILVPMVLEEEHLVSPEGAGGLRAGDKMTDQLLFAVMLGRTVVTEDLEHNRISGDIGQLVKEVILVLVGPAIDVIRLNLDLERPVRFFDFVTVLIELGELHNGHATCMVRHLVQVLANGLSGARVLHLTKDVRPSVLEEVEGGLSIEGEHSEPVSGSHTVSKELHAVAWGSVSHLWHSSGELGDSHDGVLAALEDTRVGGVVGRNELHKRSGTDGMGSLFPARWHGVRDTVEGQVHILLEEAIEFLTNEELLGGSVFKDVSPDHLLLAVG